MARTKGVSYTCGNCGKNYRSAAGRSRHEKSCGEEKNFETKSRPTRNRRKLAAVHFFEPESSPEREEEEDEEESKKSDDSSDDEDDEKPTETPRRKKSPEKFCGFCGSSFLSVEELCVHLQNVHDLPANIQSFVFYSENQFQNWKHTVEKSVWDTLHPYNYGRCMSDKGGIIMQNFVCKPPKNAGKKAPIWDCSAFMRVRKSSKGVISVRACLYHYGHDLSQQMICKQVPVPDEAEDTKFFDQTDNSFVQNEAEGSEILASEMREIAKKVKKISNKEILAQISEKVAEIQELVKFGSTKRGLGVSRVEFDAREIPTARFVEVKGEPTDPVERKVACSSEYHGSPPVGKKRFVPRVSPLATKYVKID